MQINLSQLKRGEKGVITDVSSNNIPLKLLEMGCLPGNEVTLLQVALFRDPLFVDINGSRVAIRKATAEFIQIQKLPNE